MSKGILGLLDFYYEYPIARMLGDEHVYVFKYGTLGGLINLQKQDKIGLLAIRNLEPHNGQFIKFIEMVEDFARKNHLDIVIEYLMNDRLDKWFERRSYEKFGEHRILRYQRRQNENTTR